MLANGFAYAEAKGENVQQKMRYADSAIKEMFGTREMMQSFEKAALTESRARQKMLENTNPDPNLPEIGTNQTESSDDDRPAVINEGFEAYKKEQERIVKEYNLPYPLPNSVSKILDLEYTLTMKRWKRWKVPTPSPPSPALPPPSKIYDHGAITRWRVWWDADMLMSHDAKYEHWDKNVYGYWRHAGIYSVSPVMQEGALYDGFMTDAYPEKGVRISTWKFWTTTYEELGGFYIPPSRKFPSIWDGGETTLGPSNSWDRWTVAYMARLHIGKPYGITAKWDNQTFYCSKLLWKAYAGIVDIDSNGGPFVFPDDIVASPYVSFWRSSRSKCVANC